MKKLFTLIAIALITSSAFAWTKGDPIYLIGGATEAGWDLDKKIEMTYSNGEYTLKTDLITGEFKFLTESSWDLSKSWLAPAAETKVTQVNETFGINYGGSDDNKYNVTDAGEFVLRIYWVDDYTAKLQVTRNIIYLVGNATTAGWTTTGGIPVLYNSETNEFVWEGTLQEGQFRFLTVDSWEKCLTAPGATTEITSANETFGLWWNANDGNKDYNFEVIEKGSYTLRVYWQDVATSKIQITRRDIYLIGSATSGGWTTADAQKMTFTDDGYILNDVSLNFGLFKFLSQNTGAWWPGYTAPNNCEIIADGQDFNVLTYNDQSKDNKFLAYNGTYNLKIYWDGSSWMLETNTTRDAWNIDKTSLKIVGGATPNGWTATAMEQVSEGVFKFTGKLNADSDGEFKFTWGDSWWPALLAPSANFPVEDIGASTNLFYAQSELTNEDDRNAVDRKFKVTSDGGWTITVDLNNLTVSAEQLYIINGNKAYSTLAAAIADASDGDVISVGQDVAETNTIDKYIKIDAQGHSVGNLTVTSAGKLELTSNATLGTLILQSQPNTGAGQLVCQSGISVSATECYLERQFYTGTYQQIWYSFGVPFTVDASNGVYTTAGTQFSNQKYYINGYDGDNRATYGITTRGQKGYAWTEPDELTAGEGYMIYITDKSTKTLRFKASNVSEVFDTDNTKSVNYTYYTGSKGNNHNGWNFITQPCTQNTSVEASAGTFSYIQVLHDGASSTQGSYTTEPVTGETILAPFTAFFYQANADGTLTFTKSANAATIKSAESEAKQYFEVTLTSADGISDKTYVSASEDASESEYQIGKDLAKCGWSSAAVQICTYDFEQALTVNQAKAFDGTADLALVMSTPKAGNYSIRVRDFAEIGEIFLTKDGEVIADLNDGEAYEFASAKGINKEYGLRIVLSDDISTDAIEGEAVDNIYAQGKTIYVNGVKAAEVLNLLGQQVANPVQAAGIYVVKANGTAVKLNVE